MDKPTQKEFVTLENLSLEVSGCLTIVHVAGVTDTVWDVMLCIYISLGFIASWRTEKVCKGAEQMAQWIKHLPCQLEDQVGILSTT